MITCSIYNIWNFHTLTWATIKIKKFFSGLPKLGKASKQYPMSLLYQIFLASYPNDSNNYYMHLYQLHTYL